MDAAGQARQSLVEVPRFYIAARSLSLSLGSISPMALSETTTVPSFRGSVPLLLGRWHSLASEVGLESIASYDPGLGLNLL